MRFKVRSTISDLRKRVKVFCMKKTRYLQTFLISLNGTLQKMSLTLSTRVGAMTVTTSPHCISEKKLSFWIRASSAKWLRTDI